MPELTQLRLIAVDTDGVLLTDTYSPVIKQFVTEHGGTYTAQVERTVWGSPQLAAGQNMALACMLPWTAKETIDAFFEVREAYLADHPVQLTDGVAELLATLHATGAQVVSYGGRDKSYTYDKYLNQFAEYFDGPQYINVNDFRPGMKEIVRDVFDFGFDEVLFIDDINRVAEVTKALGAGFLGVPASMPHNFQREEMQETGVSYLVDSIGKIDRGLLEEVDEAMREGRMWQEER